MAFQPLFRPAVIDFRTARGNAASTSRVQVRAARAKGTKPTPSLFASHEKLVRQQAQPAERSEEEHIDAIAKQVRLHEAAVFD
jgi:hypothetical protein